MAREYKTGGFMYPPRPSLAVPPRALFSYERADTVAQAKLNGSCALLVVAPDGSFKVWNREGEPMTRVKLRPADVSALAGKDGYRAFAGEMLNKHKRLGGGYSNDDRFVIFDLLATGGATTEGTVLRDRLLALDSMLDRSPCCEWFDTVNSSVGVVRTHRSGFEDLWQKLQPEELVEGLVVKRSDAALSVCTSDSANSGWQWKFRKPTKNYRF